MKTDQNIVESFKFAGKMGGNLFITTVKNQVDFFSTKDFPVKFGWEGVVDCVTAKVIDAKVVNTCRMSVATHSDT